MDDTSYLPPPSPYHGTSGDTLPIAHDIVNDQYHDDETTPLPPPPTSGEYDYMNEIGNEEFQTTSKKNNMCVIILIFTKLLTIWNINLNSNREIFYFATCTYCTCTWFLVLDVHVLHVLDQLYFFTANQLDMDYLERVSSSSNPAGMVTNCLYLTTCSWHKYNLCPHAYKCISTCTYLCKKIMSYIVCVVTL